MTRGTFHKIAMAWGASSSRAVMKALLAEVHKDLCDFMDREKCHPIKVNRCGKEDTVEGRALLMVDIGYEQGEWTHDEVFDWAEANITKDLQFAEGV